MVSRPKIAKKGVQIHAKTKTGCFVHELTIPLNATDSFLDTYVSTSGSFSQRSRGISLIIRTIAKRVLVPPREKDDRTPSGAAAERQRDFREKVEAAEPPAGAKRRPHVPWGTAAEQRGGYRKSLPGKRRPAGISRPVSCP